MPTGVLASKTWSVLGLRLKMSLGVSVPARARDDEMKKSGSQSSDRWSFVRVEKVVSFIFVYNPLCPGYSWVFMGIHGYSWIFGSRLNVHQTRLTSGIKPAAQRVSQTNRFMKFLSRSDSTNETEGGSRSIAAGNAGTPSKALFCPRLSPELCTFIFFGVFQYTW